MPDPLTEKEFRVLVMRSLLRLLECSISGNVKEMKELEDAIHKEEV